MSNTYEDDYDAMQATLAAILNGDAIPEDDGEQTEPEQPVASPPAPVAEASVECSEPPAEVQDEVANEIAPVQNLDEALSPSVAPGPMDAGSDFDFDDVMGMFDGPQHDETLEAPEDVTVRLAHPEDVPEDTSGADVATGEVQSVADAMGDSELLETAGARMEENGEGSAVGGDGSGGDEATLDELIAAEPEAEADPDAIFTNTPQPTAEEARPMPTFTSEEIAEQIDIRNLATLVTLNTARWHGKVKDKRASEYAAATAGADPEAFETHKKLLAGADEKLRRVHKAIDDARTKHYKMTLPWSTTGRADQGKRKGAALLPNAKFFDYTQEMAHAKVDMETALEDFVKSYANDIAKAKSRLGDRFDPSEYPHPTTIQDHFGLKFDFHPIPIGSDFQGLADQQADKLSRKLDQKNRQMIENAMQETWTRAYELVAQAADRFGQPDKMFHYTLIDKLRAAATDLASLNITSDPVITKAQQVIQKNLTGYEAEDIRKDEALRARLGQIAKALLKEMNDHASK